MYRSNYYQERNAGKSNSLTSIGMTLVLVFMGIFMVYYLVVVTHDNLERGYYEKRCSIMLRTKGVSFSTILYLKRTADEPTMSSARVHLFKVTNYRERFRNLMADAYVKCEISENDVMYDQFVSASSRVED